MKKEGEALMKKCLKITLDAVGLDVIQEIQKKGGKEGVEGTIQPIVAEKQLKIIVCGDKDHVDKFVDILHKTVAQAGIAEINIEPFVKIKDYRGAFRIIE